MKTKNTKAIIFDVLKQNKKYFALLIFVIILVVACSLIPPQILRVIIDQYLMKGKYSGLLIIGLIYLGSFALIGIFDFLKGYILTIFGQKIVREIRDSMSQKLVKIKASYFTKNNNGAITSKFMNDVENINALFTDGVISMIIDCFKVIGIVISIFIFSSALGIFTICLVPIIGGLTSFFRKRMLLSQINNLKELGNVNNHISETIRNMLMIKSFSKEKYMEKNYKKFLEENYITMNKVNFYDSCYSPIIQIIMALSIAFVFYFSAGGTNFLGISIGMIAASVNLITNMFAPIDSLGMEIQSIQQGLSGISSIDDFFAEKEIAQKKSIVDIGKLKKYGAKIDFKNMSFYYEKGKDVLRNINLEILPGEKVSFVGRTGVGKSTLFRLIEGLLEPTAGKLLINDMRTSQIGSKQKREIFGYVEQNFRFLNGNIGYQISLGDDTITEGQIKNAMDFVGLNDYVMSMEKGYEEDAKGGIMFSQGQKQLLSIARAIVTNPPILLLDEITANLDAVTEEKVVQVLKQAGKEKTILSIAHRISTVLNSDKVVLLENNRIKSVGTPAEIIRDSTWLKSSVDMEQLAK